MWTPSPGVIELRQYTLHPGQRETLIALFEREFIHTQAAVGMPVLGIFRDAARDDRFVWLRGFADMARRARSLAAFYDGPVWQQHRDAANATMIDSDDVLLLRPLTALPRPGDGSDGTGPWQAHIALLSAAPDEPLRTLLRASPACWLESEPSPNTFPRLPVREGQHALVVLSRGPTPVPDAVRARLQQPLATLDLLPTPHSPCAERPSP